MKLQLFKTPLFKTFLQNIVRLGYDSGFVHNDLHAGNVLAVLDSNNQPIAYKIIDLGRAYSLLQVDKTILQNEYAKLMPPPQIDEPLSSFTNRVNKIQSIYDCITVADTSGWIKVISAGAGAGSTEFQQRTLILFDVIGLLNGLGYFKDQEEKLSNNPKSINITNIYELLKYWYGTYIHLYRNYKLHLSLPIEEVIKEINQEVFINGFWVDVACFNYLRETFYLEITAAKKQEIEKLITSFPQTGGKYRNRSKKMSAGSSIDITPQSYGEILADIATEKAKLGKARTELNPVQEKQKQGIPSKLPTSAPTAIAVKGGKKKNLLA